MDVLVVCPGPLWFRQFVRQVLEPHARPGMPIRISQWKAEVGHLRYLAVYNAERMRGVIPKRVILCGRIWERDAWWRIQDELRYMQVRDPNLIIERTHVV